MRNFFPSLILIFSLFLLPHESQGEKEKEDPNKQVQSFFESFFKDGGQKAFKQFVKQSKKFTNVQPLDGEKEDDDEDKEEKDKDKEAGAGAGDKKPEEEKKISKAPSVAAKSFAFYMTTYGCQKSQIYNEFLRSYKEKKLTVPKEGDKPDEWLMKLADKDSDTDGTATTSVKDAEENLKDLDEEQKKLLSDGEEQMPIAAQTYLKFVKSEGCPDSMLKRYKKFNDIFKKEMDKLAKGGKKFASSYYVTKAEMVVKEKLDEEE